MQSASEHRGDVALHRAELGGAYDTTHMHTHHVSCTRELHVTCVQRERVFVNQIDEHIAPHVTPPTRDGHGTARCSVVESGWSDVMTLSWHLTVCEHPLVMAELVLITNSLHPDFSEKSLEMVKKRDKMFLKK
jgi:hypothetical protein